LSAPRSRNGHVVEWLRNGLQTDRFGFSFNGLSEKAAKFRPQRRERQLEGIAKAKAAGIYKGRPASIDAARVQELKASGMGPTDIAKALKIGRASVYRVLVERAD
jgi:DNA invertase Pin-like site-specific DNA recombinase